MLHMAILAHSSIRGPDEMIVSAPVLAGLVRAGDFALFIAAALVAAAGVGAWFDAPFWQEAPLRGSAALAGAIGAATGCAILDQGAPTPSIGSATRARRPG